MKKLLLSSIIMLGICSFATAQKATESKAKNLTPAAAATPQKEAVSDQRPVIANADGTVAGTVAEAKAASAVATPVDAKVAPSDAADLKQKEATRAAQKPAPAKRNKLGN